MADLPYGKDKMWTQDQSKDKVHADQTIVYVNLFQLLEKVTIVKVGQNFSMYV